MNTTIRSMRRLAVVLALAAGVLAGGDKKNDPSQIGKRDVGKGINFYSLEKEISLGKQLAEEVGREAKLLGDSALTEFVNRLGQNLARHSDAKVPCTFQVIESDELNAFALPGGFIFVNSGLLKLAETEAELASAMAHEVAHVAGRHMTRQASRRQIADWASLPLVLLGGWAGYAARQAAGAGIPAAFLKFDRDFETEADFLGLQYLYAAGYDPNAAVEVFEKMQSLERRRPGVISKVFATHPLHGDRLRKVQEEIQKILPARAEYVVTTSEYDHLRAHWLAQKDPRKRPDDPSRPRLRVPD